MTTITLAAAPKSRRADSGKPKRSNSGKKGRPGSGGKGRPTARKPARHAARAFARSLVALVSVASIAGCSTAIRKFDGYDRPDLFYPPMEAIREDIANQTQLTKGASTAPLELVLPAADLAVSQTGYILEIADRCPDGSSPHVLTFPSGLAGERTRIRQTNRFQFTLATGGLGPSQEIELIARSCAAADMTDAQAEERGLLVRQQLTIKGTASDFAVNFPSEEWAANSGKHTVLVQDTCKDGSSPTTQTNVPAAITKPPVRDGSLFKYEVDTSQLAKVSDFSMTVTSCQAAGLSESEAARRKLVKTDFARVGYKRITTTFNVMAERDAAELFGRTFAQIFTVATVEFQNTNPDTVLIYGASLAAEVRFLAAKKDIKEKLFGGEEPTVAGLRGLMWGDTPALEALDFQEDFRPLSLSDILGIFTFRQQADPRQRVMAYTKSFGELVTAAAEFFTGRDFAKGLSIFTGVFTPEMEKLLLWDMTMHLKNLEQRSLKEVEELSPNKSMQKVVFFPRRPIQGILPSLPVYIAEIRPGEVPVTGALINKEGTVQGQKPAGQ
jgi:hypothetical protein